MFYFYPISSTLYTLSYLIAKVLQVRLYFLHVTIGTHDSESLTPIFKVRILLKALKGSHLGNPPISAKLDQMVTYCPWFQGQHTFDTILRTSKGTSTTLADCVASWPEAVKLWEAPAPLLPETNNQNKQLFVLYFYRTTATSLPTRQHFCHTYYVPGPVLNAPDAMSLLGFLL